MIVYKLGQNVKNKGTFIRTFGTPDGRNLALIEWRIDGMSDRWRTVESEDKLLVFPDDLQTMTPQEQPEEIITHGVMQ